MAHQLNLAIPDNRTEIDDIIGDGDTVAVRYTCRGTHNGELFGVAPTNRTLTTSGIEMYRLSGGRIVECWGQYDMSQLFTPASSPHPPRAPQSERGLSMSVSTPYPAQVELPPTATSPGGVP